MGAYTSPHVAGWHERLNCDEAGFERAVARVRGPAEELGSTQFEVLTAAALLEFAEQGADAAVVEAGLGGRLDATNVVDAEVVLLTNVALEHTEVLGETREEIAQEKLAVAHVARVVVMSDNTFEHLVPGDATIVQGGAREAAEAFLGRQIEHDADVSLAGRLERRDASGCWRGSRPATTSSASRSCARNGSTSCSSASAVQAARSSRRPPATRARCPQRISPRKPQRTSRKSFRSRIRPRPSRARVLLSAQSSSPAPSICSQISTRERKTVQVDESWRTDHRLRVRGRCRAVDRGDRVRSRLHRRSTSPITGERK